MHKIFCNKCGKLIHPDSDFVQYVFRRGYGSALDGDRFSYDLCCACADEEAKAHIESYKYSPMEGDH